MIYKEEQKGVKQVLLLEDGTKFITISMQGSANVDNISMANIIARTIPGQSTIKDFNIYSYTYLQLDNEIIVNTTTSLLYLSYC